MKAWALALLICGGAAADELRVEVIPVVNRPATDLVATLAPIVAPEGAVSALDNRLVVKATPAALEQVHALVRSLDVAPRTLFVTVRQAGTTATRSAEGAVAGQISGGGGSVSVSPDGTRVTTTRSQTRVSGAFGSSSGQESASDLQRLQVLEGRPAFIRTGTSIATPSVVTGPDGALVASAWQDADHGFWVVPRLSGSLVTLELATARDDFVADGVIRGQRVETTLSGRLGDWLHVGGIASRADDASHGIASAASSSRVTDFNVEVKVEAADTP